MKEETHTLHENTTWIPTIENRSRLKPFQRVLFIGMGGSVLSGEIYKSLRPRVPFVTYSYYGLPHIPEEEKDETLVVLSSYSGDTEEVLSSFEDVRAQGYNVACITKGGKLLELSEDASLPYCVLPHMSSARLSVIHNLIALAYILDDPEVIEEIHASGDDIVFEDIEEKGKELALWLQNAIPLVYASEKDSVLSLLWKVSLNETAKVPAFSNTLPFLNHTEMEGFDVISDDEIPHSRFKALFITPLADDERISRRIEKTRDIYERRDIQTRELRFEGNSRMTQILSCILLAEVTSSHLARLRGVDESSTSLIERFKKHLKK